ncbi:MAG: hypothetical protein GF403_04905 [Candidatus Coatesbacteria bacterium]|nr:hypothetical protein [Candidatus Coatesbacteria bacterium]
MRKPLIFVLLLIVAVGAMEMIPWAAGQWAAYESNEGPMTMSVVELPGSSRLWLQVEMTSPEGEMVVQMAFTDEGLSEYQRQVNQMLADPDVTAEEYGGFQQNMEDYTDFTDEIRVAMIDPASGEPMYLSMGRETFEMFNQMGAAAVDEETQARLDAAYENLEWEKGVPYSAAGRTFDCLKVVTDLSEGYYSDEVPVSGMVFMHTAAVAGAPESDMVLTGYGLNGAENAAAAYGEPMSFEELMTGSGGY